MSIGTMSRVRLAECLVSNRSDRKKGTHSLQSYRAMWSLVTQICQWTLNNLG